MRAVVFIAGAMGCASMHRVTFSVLAVPIRSEFGLSLPQMGVLHSAVLAGYILGQVQRPSHCIPSETFPLHTARDLPIAYRPALPVTKSSHPTASCKT